MPSPFPRLDPFIEGQGWSGFHHLLIGVVVETLTPHAIPRYIFRIEETVYQEHEADDGSAFIIPDARHVYLTLREAESDRIVTVIEILSPKNKRAGNDGRRRYLRKRERVLLSEAHLVEIDLLRGGARLPMVAPLPAGDYYAIITREERRRTAEVYAWSLRDPLPTIPVPVAGEDPDLRLDLQACCTTVYDRAAYAYSLKYRRPVTPPLGDADAAWVEQVLSATK